MTISRRALFGKLNLTLFRGIESATAFAKLRGNPYVELTHWIHQLWQLNDSDLHRICRHYQIDAQAIQKDFASALSSLPSGATSLTDFSSHIEAAIERAWLLSSLEFGVHCVRGAWLFAALLQTPDLRRVLLGISPAFQRIPADQLTEAIGAIVVGSPEGQEGPHDGSGLLSALPGEASAALADAASEGKSALRRYCTDLTERASQGQIDPVIGRGHEIRTMVDILLRRRQNNPLLTGDAGVGKTAVVEGLALAIAQGEVPPDLKNCRLWSLDVGALLAGASMRGEFESRLKALLEEAGKSVQPVILFIDEVHTLVGAGGQSGTGDAANLLKPALARGTLRTIGATTWSEYKRHIEKDPALTRRFQTLQVAEPDEVAAIEMVRGLVATFAEHHGVLVLDEAVRAAVTLSHRYIPARQLPDKAISLLDTACARVAMSLHAPPPEVEQWRHRIAALQVELELLGQEGVVAQGSDARALRLDKARSQLDAAQQALSPRGDAQYGQFVGAPDAPNWAEIERDCRRLLLRTRDINLFVWLCRARTRLAQAAGLAQSLVLLVEALRTWPEAVHPQLVIEGERDPAVRANALAALVDPEGLLSDVREVVIAANAARHLTVREVERAFAMPRAPDAASPEAMAQQLADLAAAASGDDQAPLRLLAQAAEAAAQIVAGAGQPLGPDAPPLHPLVRLLAPSQRTGSSAPPAAAATRPDPLPSWPASTPAGEGLATRDDILRDIRKARRWFENHEPSSPVAVLLKQAERMTGLRFSQVADAIPLDLLRKWDADEEASL